MQVEAVKKHRNAAASESEHRVFLRTGIRHAFVFAELGRYSIMDWRRLLEPKRVQDLYRKGPTTKSTRDPRTEFERDYDRAIFSTPVRRLQDKAQVFPLEASDAVRTRLTHSLEVSTVARDLGGQAARWIRQRGQVDEEQARAIATIAATCGLIHDLGNPPFGHAGERWIQDWFDSRDDSFFAEFAEQQGANGRESPLAKDFLRFEGNAQTIRIVSRLQVLAHEFGLNLTCGTMSALCKYVARSDEVGKGNFHEFKKPGYHASEADLVNLIREITGTGNARNPITYLVEAADDLVYSTIDLEDGVKKGVIGWDALISALVSEPDTAVLRKCIEDAVDYIKQASVPLSGKARDEALAVVLRNKILTESVPAVIEKFRQVYDRIMSGDYHGELVTESAVGPMINACKQTAGRLIYTADEILRLELMGREVMHKLMTLFWKAVSEHDGSPKTKTFAGKLYNLMSSNYRVVAQRALEAKALPEKYCKLMLVTDYICGMTDTYACTLHKRLTNG
jgi:dGTPase